MGRIQVAAIIAILISVFHLTFGNFHLGEIKPQANESGEAYDGAVFGNSMERKVKEEPPSAAAKTKRGIVSRGMDNDGDKVRKFEGRNSRCRFHKRFLERRQGNFPRKVMSDAKQNMDEQFRMLESAFRRGPKYHPNGKDFSVANPDDTLGEKYYYYDFGPLMNSQTERIFGINDMNIPDPYMMRFENAKSVAVQRHHKPVVDKNSCKQYLDFLRYAFEQLDSSPTKNANDFRDYDYYYEYPYDYDQTQRKMPTPTLQEISANMDLLKSLTYSEGASPVEAMQGVYPLFELHTTPPNGRNFTEATNLPQLIRSNLSSLPGPSTVLANAATPNWRALPTAKTDSGFRPGSTPVTGVEIDKITFERGIPATSTVSSVHYRNFDGKSGAQAGNSTKEPRTLDAKQDDSSVCHEKMFPCPDNLNVTYPINGFCNRFIVCESGKPHPEYCQEGLHFNLVTKQCDLPHNSICTYSCPREKGFYGIPGNCEGFFRCQNWYPEYRMCPPRMHWDLKAKICTFQDLSSCPLKCDAPYEVKSYNGVCNAYIVCTRSVPQYHKCPDGTIFDRKELRCLPKSESLCVNDEDYIGRNRGVENGLKKLCADIKMEDGVSRWCQEPTNLD